MDENKLTRRSALRKLLYIAGGTLLLPACYRRSGQETIALENITITEEQQNLLSELVETIIPSDNTPGGKELLLHLFVLKMVDDCHSPEDQSLFVEGLAGLPDYVQKATGKDFVRLDTAQRVAVLEGLKDVEQEPLKRFFSIIKRRTTQGYTQSKYVMVDLKKYELVPGRYDGYKKVVG